MVDDILEYNVFTDGERLFESGNRGSEAYLIIAGKVRIVLYDEEEDEEIGVNGPDEIIGEMAIISNEPRMATAIAIGETHCYSISRKLMMKLIDSADLETRSMIYFLVNFLRDLHLEFKRDEIDPTAEDDETLINQESRAKRILIARRILNSEKTNAHLQGVEPVLAKLCRLFIDRVREHLAILDAKTMRKQ